MIRENLDDVVILGGILGGYYYATDSTVPVDVPEWWPLVAVACIVGGLGILFATGAIDDLFPEEKGVFLIVVNACRLRVIEVWELTEDQWEDLEVQDGPLKHLPGCKHRAYSCVAYNPTANFAISTWRKSISAQEAIGHARAEDAYEAIQAVRGDLEEKARYGRALRRQLPAVVRGLDRRRAREQNRALDEHLMPQFQGGQSIDEMIAAELPDDALPEHLKQDEAEEHAEVSQNDEADELDEVVDDVEDDLEDSPEPAPATNGTGGGA